MVEEVGGSDRLVKTKVVALVGIVDVGYPCSMDVRPLLKQYYKSSRSAKAVDLFVIRSRNLASIGHAEQV